MLKHAIFFSYLIQVCSLLYFITNIVLRRIVRKHQYFQERKSVDQFQFQIIFREFTTSDPVLIFF